VRLEVQTLSAMKIWKTVDLRLLQSTITSRTKEYPSNINLETLKIYLC